MARRRRFGQAVQIEPAPTPPALAELPSEAPTLQALSLGVSILTAPLIEIAQPNVKVGNVDAFLPSDRKLRGMDPTGSFILSILARVARINNGFSFASTLHDLLGLVYGGRAQSSSPAGVNIDTWTTPGGTVIKAFGVVLTKSQALNLQGSNFSPNSVATECGGGFSILSDLASYLRAAYTAAGITSGGSGGDSNRYIFTGHGAGGSCAFYAALRANQTSQGSGLPLTGPCTLCAQFGPIAFASWDATDAPSMLRNFKNAVVQLNDDPAFAAGMLMGVMTFATNNANQLVSERVIRGLPGATGYEDYLWLGPQDRDVDRIANGIVRFTAEEGSVGYRVRVDTTSMADQVASLTDASYDLGLRMADDGPCNSRSYSIAMESYCRDKRLTPYPLFTNLVTASRGLDDLDMLV